MLKKHWPVLVAVLAVIASIALESVAMHSTDTGVVIYIGVFIFMVLFPLAGAIMGGWYGWRSRTPLKWLLPLAVYLGIYVYMLALDWWSDSGLSAGNTYLLVGLFSCLSTLVVEAITAFIAWLCRRNKA